MSETKTSIKVKTSVFNLSIQQGIVPNKCTEDFKDHTR